MGQIHENDSYVEQLEKILMWPTKPNPSNRKSATNRNRQPKNFHRRAPTSERENKIWKQVPQGEQEYQQTCQENGTSITENSWKGIHIGAGCAGKERMDFGAWDQNIPAGKPERNQHGEGSSTNKTSRYPGRLKLPRCSSSPYDVAQSRHQTWMGPHPASNIGMSS